MSNSKSEDTNFHQVAYFCDECHNNHFGNCPKIDEMFEVHNEK